MTEQEWDECAEPTVFLEFLRRKPSHRKLRLFACSCVRHTPLGDGRKVWDLLTDQRSIRAVEVAERYADGLSSKEEMDAAASVAHKLAGEGRDVALYAAASPGRTDVAFAWFSIRNALFAVLNRAEPATKDDQVDVAKIKMCAFFRDIFGPLPFRSIPFDFRWVNSTVTSLAKVIYAARNFDCLPILADALVDAGCTNEEMLAHCRGPGPHVRGCWVIDLLLGKELQPHDLDIVLTRFVDRRRQMRVVHRPTGISVEGLRTREERLWFLKERLMKDLVQKVTCEMRGSV